MMRRWATWPTSTACRSRSLTDLYQLTMAQAYRSSGKAETEAVFHLFFRRNPFGGGFAVACGLSRVLDLLADFRFGQEDLDYLARQTGNDGRPLFEPAFLRELSELRLACDVDAVPEGTVVFPYEPLRARARARCCRRSSSRRRCSTSSTSRR